MAPVIDVGTFAVGRIGVSGHPVAWVWRKAATPLATEEHYALYRSGDQAEGFLRPNATSADLGYRFTFIPTSTGQPLDHANLAAFKTFVKNAAVGCGMDASKITFVRADPTGPGAVAVFLGVGFQRARHASGTGGPVVAWAQRKTGQYVERWRLCTDPVAGYQMPGLAHQSVDLWFTGQVEVETDEFDNISESEDPMHISAPILYYGITE